MIRVTTCAARFALVASAIASLGCEGGYGPWYMGISGPPAPFAIGTAWTGDPSGVAAVGFTRATVHCVARDPQGFPACPNGSEGGVAAIKSASFKDSAGFEITRVDPAAVQFRPLAPSATSLLVTAADPDGKLHTASLDVAAAVPDDVLVVPTCYGDRAPTAIVAPTSSSMLLRVGVSSAGTSLRALGLPRLDFGALVAVGALPTADTQSAVFTFPAASTVTYVTSLDFPLFHKPVHAFTIDDTTGVVLRMPSAGPFKAQSGDIDVDVAVVVDGEPACQEDFAVWTKTVLVDAKSEGVCDLEYAQGRFEAHVADPPTVHVRGFAPGKCTLHATSDLTGQKVALDIEFTGT